MTTALALRDADREALRAEAGEAQGTVATLEAMELASPEDAALAGDLLHAVKDRWKELEAKRTSVTQPILAAKRAVDDLFRPVQEPLARAERVLKGKIAAYTLACQAAQAAAVVAVGAGDAPVTAIVPTPVLEGVGVRVLWTWEVIEPDMVPRRFLMVDHAALAKHAAFADTERTPPRPVAGVRFFRRGQVTVR